MVHAAPDVPGIYTVSISGPGFVASPFKITSSKIISSTERIEDYRWNFLQAFLPFNNLKKELDNENNDLMTFMTDCFDDFDDPDDSDDDSDDSPDD